MLNRPPSATPALEPWAGEARPPDGFGRRARDRSQDPGLAASLALPGIRARCGAAATLGNRWANRRNCSGEAGRDPGPGSPRAAVRLPPGSRSAALYVHWPYCEKRCSYCNFNKYIPRGLNEDAIRRCLTREATTLLKLSGVQRIHSVFFGGGTPSLASPHTVASVLEAIAQTTYLPAKAEVTLEANPTSSKASKLAAFRGAGINRLSIGIQSLDNTELQLLGRTHSVSEALGTLEEARRLYPGRTSVDLMFGLPGQKVEQWLQQLQELLSLCDDHISLYQLTLERGTLLFAQVQRGTLPSPDPEDAAEMYQEGRAVLKEAGFRQYEVSNFARNEALSTHNWTYWQGGQYIGVGPGAHGRFVPQGEGGSHREARIQTLEPDNWMKEVSMFGHGTRKRVSLSELELLEEVLALGLRTDTGITHQHWLQFEPHWSLWDAFGESEEVRELQSRGLLLLDHRGLRCSWEGLAVLDTLLPILLLQLQKARENRPPPTSKVIELPPKEEIHASSIAQTW
ncbi:radical S-adenosyl methionine domain-containing protein 1, mitochondrial [Dromiciops gliroides]|uniref:radical S-adenosyl methionine domain-containing protein 1, mitochondrial n=1 Tax=Dromiciops gliroides TaxID=33562 RepID=UPI001CC41A6C|nr:radical S-adenosyl methionine domain-containing protein 1, mitochondrial [Dromiciops gliroides]